MLAKKLLICVIAVLAAAAVAAGCGSGSDSTSSAGPNTENVPTAETESEDVTSGSTPASFLHEAKGICRRALLNSQRGAAILAKGEEPEAKDYAAAAVRVYRKAAKEIEALEPPAAEKAQIEAFLTALGKGLDVVEQRRSSISSTAELEEILTPAGNRAAASGLAACAFGH